MLGYLRGLGVVPQPGLRVPQTPAEELLDGYGRWLLAERGLRPTVARGYPARCGRLSPLMPAAAGPGCGT